MQKKFFGYAARTLLVVVALATMIGFGAFATPSAQAAYSWPNVGQGSKGENVASIQLFLNAHGASLTVDSNFGPLTTAAVKSFQSSHTLGVDGIVGPQTWPALIITTQRGSTGAAVEALQRQLNTHGKSLSTDGDFGSLTTSAVRSFQTSSRIGVDGIAGLQTWSALVSGGSSSPTPTPPSGPTPTPPSGDKHAKILSLANDIENGKAEPGWSGGRIPYSWAAGHGSKVGPSLGSCDGYTGSIHPCPADTTVGLDCSGFSRWVYDLAYGSDVLGSGNTDSQIKRLHQVSASSAQAGDLVFFGTLSNTHHVGIYIGDGKMISAYQTGTDVQTNSIKVSDFVGYFAY